MVPIEEFESQLKEIVHAKRLSGSKLSKLTETSLKSMAEDSQMVSILLQTHKSLEPSCKVSSLYVFDALARAAKSKAVKHNLSVDSKKGNCATFLDKLDGVLDDLFHDMCSHDQQELKDKSKKIFDIWTKGRTFPESTLFRLSGLLAGVNKETENADVPSSDPRVIAPHPPSPVSTPPPHEPPTTSALLLLLQHAAQQSSSTTAQQLLLQQLAQAAQLQNTHSSVMSPGHFASPLPTWDAAPSQSPPTPDERTGLDSHGYRYNSPNPVKSVKPEQKTRDPRNRSSRDNGDADTVRGRDPRVRARSPRSAMRPRDGRSSSPPSSYRGRKDINGDVESRTITEIRSGGQREEGSVSGRNGASSKSPSYAQINPHTTAAPTMVIPSSAPPPVPAAASVRFGLESFDPQLFNPLLPESWTSLGKMWEVTNGYLPSQEELMQYMMMAMMMGGGGVHQPETVNNNTWDGVGGWGGVALKGKGTM